MYFYPFGKSTYSFSYACAIGKILRDNKVGVMYFSCVASATHFLFFMVILMTEKDFTDNCKRETERREERLGRYTQPWKEDEINPEDSNGTLGILRQLYMYKKCIQGYTTP